MRLKTLLSLTSEHVPSLVSCFLCGNVVGKEAAQFSVGETGLHNGVQQQLKLLSTRDVPNAATNERGGMMCIKAKGNDKKTMQNN